MRNILENVKKHTTWYIANRALSGLQKLSDYLKYSQIVRLPDGKYSKIWLLRMNKLKTKHLYLAKY